MSECYSQYNNIRRIRKFLSFEAAKTLVQALVISRLDYCNSVLYGIRLSSRINYSAYKTQPLDFLPNTPRYSYTTLVMVDLHWLLVKFRIIFEVTLFTFKAVHGIAPTYMTSLAPPHLGISRVTPGI